MPGVGAALTVAGGFFLHRFQGRLLALRMREMRSAGRCAFY
jgi:hypothetical protein